MPENKTADCHKTTDNQEMNKIILNFKKSKPSNPSIIVAFPGFGLVGLIATEFLIDHMAFEEVGRYWFEELPATVAIHDSKMISPVGVFYNQKSNILLIHSITATHGMEWRAADLVMDVAAKVKAKEIICLDGVGVAGQGSNESQPGKASDKASSKAFYYASGGIRKKLDGKADLLKESIILGVGPALLLKSNIPVITLFAETQTTLPDSKAAAKLVEVLNAYLGLDADSKPLLEMATKFEDKLKRLVSESRKIQDLHDSKQLSYMG